MVEPVRITPENVRPRLQSGAVLFVCAYADEEKFRQMHMERAVLLNEFEAKLPVLLKNQEIVFYCS